MNDYYYYFSKADIYLHAKLNWAINISTKSKQWLTKATPSRAATARMSAHETVALQAASRRVLMASITSKPLAEFLFGPAFFSPVNVAVSSSSTDPSQP